MDVEVLRAAGVTKTYREFTAIKDVAFSCHAGLLTALLGPNGAGKSTTMRCIAGLTTPDSGSISVLGRSIADRQTRRHVGYVAEEPALFPGLTVWESFSFIARLYRLEAWTSRAESLMETYALTEHRDRQATQLSQGQRRKVALAMALLFDSSLLVLDEPFNGLDPESQLELRGQFEELRDAGKALLISTHRLAEAEEFADRFVVIRSGRVVADGDLADLRAAFPAATTLEEAYLALGAA